MKANSLVERLVLAAVVILSLAALLLVLISPEGVVNARVVYQGF